MSICYTYYINITQVGIAADPSIAHYPYVILIPIHLRTSSLPIGVDDAFIRLISNSLAPVQTNFKPTVIIKKNIVHYSFFQCTIEPVNSRN